MKKIRITLFLLLLLYPIGAISKTFLLNEKQLAILSQAVELSEQQKYDEALKEAKKAKDSDVINLIKWLQYRSNYEGNNYSETMSFVKQHPDWPSTTWLKNMAERSINIDEDYKKTIKDLGKDTPITGYAMFLLADAKVKTENYNRNEVNSLIKKAWEQGDFDVDIEQKIISDYGQILTNQNHINRIDRLLWEQKIKEAKRIIYLVDKDYSNLFTTRIFLMKKSSDYYSYSKLIPDNLLNDTGLLYQLAKEYQRRKKYDDLFNILYKIDNEGENYKKWWKIRNYLTREFLGQGAYKKAYLTASTSSAKKGSFQYAESQWLAGWISMTKLNKSVQAYKHFYQLYDNVKYPISLSRGSYWAGRVAEKEGFKNIADKWYNLAAENPSVFYGQLAHGKVNGDKPLNFPKEEKISSYRYIYKNKLLKIATMLFQVNQTRYAEKFLIKATDNIKSKKEFTQITHFARKLNNDFYRVVVAKRAVKRNFLLLEDGWPIPKYFTDDLNRRALSLAISRQESRFDKEAVSPARAYGLMQVIAPTAKQVAKELGLKYSKEKLLEDPYYNVKLGNYYINKLVDKFDGSLVLAIASYNAGPTNIMKWIERHGDPRNLKKPEDVIQWIEKIPFKETRNYVQRVLENRKIYKQILDNESPKLDQDLLH